jgi:integrase
VKLAKDNYVTINGIKYYRLRKTIGRDKNDNPIIKPFYGKNKRDAESKYLKWRDDRVKGLSIDSEQSLTNAMNIWLWQIERMSGNKSTTFARYEVVYRLDIDGYELGFRPLAQVDKLAVQAHFKLGFNSLYCKICFIIVGSFDRIIIISISDVLNHS